MDRIKEFFISLFSGKRKYFLITGLALIALITGFIQIYPLGMPEGEDYFAKPGERVLQEDEIGQWKYVSRLYQRMEATGDTFAEWDEGMMSRWKYAIAFTAYGMPSLAMIEPQNKKIAQYYLSLMINKMKSKKVWREWVDYGFGEDPICFQNVMYKGHLNLMYGLYQLMSGDRRYEKEFVWLTRQIVIEIDQHSKEGQYEGTNCEPDQYFVQCNAIALLSLKIFDRLYGTDYTNNQVKRVLGFIHKRLVDPKTGLYYHQYHPSHDIVEKQMSGYTNAWSAVMLNYFEPEFNRKVYKSFKEKFVVEIGPYAYVKEDIHGGASKLATAYGMLAAKEFKDISLFTKLRNSMDKWGELVQHPVHDYKIYRKGDNTLANGMTMAFKMHVGWKQILDMDLNGRKILAIPSVSGMNWKDLLPQKINQARVKFKNIPDF